MQLTKITNLTIFMTPILVCIAAAIHPADMYIYTSASQFLYNWAFLSYLMGLPQWGLENFRTYLKTSSLGLTA